LKSEIDKTSKQISDEVIALVRKEIGAVAALREVLVVQRLPKTRSGKILRKLLRQIADDLEYNIPSTIDDITIVDEIKSVYKQEQIGIHKNISHHE
jgi:propionyl-CoA synthetase